MMNRIGSIERYKNITELNVSINKWILYALNDNKFNGVIDLY